MQGTIEYKIGVKLPHADESMQFSKWMGERAAQTELVGHLRHMNGPFQVRPRTSNDFGPQKPASETALRAIQILHDGHPTFCVIRTSGRRQLIVRAAIAQPKLIDTTGNARVDAMHTAVWDRFHGKVSSFGICSCRPIDGTNEWSQHAYCNAEDIHGSPSVMQNVANFLVKDHKKYDVCNVIYNHRIWNSPAGWHAYSGINPHTDHVHADFLPQGTGTPPCAR